MKVNHGVDQADPPRDYLIFFVNGAKHVVRDVQPQTTLLQYLRRVGLTGTKLGCGEGGCGACTVMVSAFDYVRRVIRHTSANACLAPLCSVDWCHVTTVEGVGSMRQGLHPVQKRIAEMHGSQCGFCTPGMVMALYALLRSNPAASVGDIERGLDGNLCRCTGYRPILDAAKTLGCDGDAPNGCCRVGGGGGCPCMDAGVCTTNATPKDKAIQPVPDSASESSSILSTVATNGSSVPMVNGFGGGGGGGGGGGCVRECTASRGRQSRYSERYTDKAEPIFPATLMLNEPSAVTIVGDTATWHFPTSLDDLLCLKVDKPSARIVAGNTKIGTEVKFKGKHYPVLISPARVPELHAIVENPDGSVFIGGAASLSSVQRALAAMEEREARRTPLGGLQRTGGAARACVDMLHWFASTQIRNVTCLAGGLATASPISDMNPLLAACGADVVLRSARGGERSVKVRDFFPGHHQVAMELDEVIVGVILPNAVGNSKMNGNEPNCNSSASLEFVRPFKQARRRQCGASIVNAAMRVRLEPEGGKWIVADAGLCFGGMAPTTVAAPRTEAFLAGKEWSAKVMVAAYEKLAEDLPLPPDVPGGQCEYRRALPPSFLFKFFVEVSLRLGALLAGCGGKSGLPPAPEIAAADRSASTNFITDPKPLSRGQQEYTRRVARLKPHSLKHGGQGAKAASKAKSADTRSDDDRGELVDSGVGKNLPHKSSSLQVSGEAVYIDDMPSPQGTLYAGLVLSQKPHARLLAVDPSDALAVKGVLRFVGARDVTPEQNVIGAVVLDEEIFAVEEVHCVGQVIGAILAESREIAEKAAKLVSVEYQDLPVLMTIEDAIGADSFFSDRNVIVDGDVASSLATADVVVEGELKIGAQDHFYLETNTSMAVPGEGSSLEVFASTQNPAKTQDFCAKVCGVDKNKVVCRTKRLGGAFGGKEMRSIFFSCVVALGAHLTGRPVRLSLDRNVDMQITGHRHAFLARYRAGVSKNGKLVGLDVTLYNNAGCSLDVSSSIMCRALLHIDNCYKWPALRVAGLVCKTNQPSHTAFRGFGIPQAMMVTETIMDHLASSLGVSPSTLRAKNLYTAGELTHFRQPLEAWNVPDGWSDIQEWADVQSRRNEVDEFNATNRWRKRGLAVIPTKFGICFVAEYMNQGGALVHVYLDGTVLVSHGGTEMGQGLHTKVCQVVANEFGIDVEKVHVSETATDRVPNSSPTGASISTDLYGMAALDACEQITERLRPVAAKLPAGAPFATVVKAAYFQRVNLSAQGFYKVPAGRCGYDFGVEASKDRGTPYNYFTQGVAASEVEVDCLTGDAKILRADIIMDIGASINPAIDIGQIEGAFVQGFGWCTMEETAWGDSEHPWATSGQLLTRGPGTYKIPSFNDVPADMRVKLMDRKNAFAVHSSKAVGEPPFFLASSAFFAIKDAIAAARKDYGKSGYFQLMSPATSERIRTACTDDFMEASVIGIDVKAESYQAKGSW